MISLNLNVKTCTEKIPEKEQLSQISKKMEAIDEISQISKKMEAIDEISQISKKMEDIDDICRTSAKSLFILTSRMWILENKIDEMANLTKNCFNNVETKFRNTRLVYSSTFNI